MSACASGYRCSGPLQSAASFLVPQEQRRSRRVSQTVSVNPFLVSDCWFICLQLDPEGRSDFSDIVKHCFPSRIGCWLVQRITERTEAVDPLCIVVRATVQSVASVLRERERPLSGGPDSAAASVLPVSSVAGWRRLTWYRRSADDCYTSSSTVTWLSLLLFSPGQSWSYTKHVRLRHLHRWQFARRTASATSCHSWIKEAVKRFAHRQLQGRSKKLTRLIFEGGNWLRRTAGGCWFHTVEMISEV